MDNSKGYIYILTNPSFPDWVKIGYADNVEKRVDTLNSSTATPFSFSIYATYEVGSRLKDLKLHEVIDKLNPNIRSREVKENGRKRVREFFAMTKEDAFKIFEAIAQISGTEDKLKLYSATKNQIKEEKEAEIVEEESMGKRLAFSFLALDIKPGSELIFVKDDTIRVKVVDDRKVEYNGEIMSLSTLANQILLSKGFKGRHNGAKYFSYNGKTIWQIRLELEEE